jgi:hypothetical protein
MVGDWEVDFWFARHPCEDWAGRMMRILRLLGEQHAKPEEPTEITTQLCQRGNHEQ